MLSSSSPQADAAHDAAGDYVVKGAWFTLVVMIIMALVANVDRQMLVLAAAPLSQSLGLSDARIGIIQGLPFAIFMIVAVYPIAWAADRFDRRWVFGICVLIWSLGTAACGLARNFEELFAAAVLIAAGEASLVPVGIAFVPELFKGRKRLLANSIFYLFGFMGLAGGLIVSGAVMALADLVHADLPTSMQALESWRLAFFLVAAPTPIFLFLIAVSRLGHRSEPVAVNGQQPPAKNHLWPYVRRHRRTVLTLFVGLSFYTLGVGGYFFFLPVATSRMFGTTPAQNGTLMGTATAIGLVLGVVIGTFINRRMTARIGPVASIRLLWMAMLAGMPIFLIFPFVSASWQVFALFGGIMFLVTAAGCALPGIMQDMAPADLRGRVAAIGNIGNGIVNGIAPGMVGWISPYLGTDPRNLIVAMGIFAIPSWIIAAMLFRMAERPFERTRLAAMAEAAADPISIESEQT
ncbi:MFS transporter [Sphingosinicella rhizophila]|uniref:MFS transporter n=1 Tax=Sphingosinicella rhizophila TaxID=3050082 RepID=A0ABU3Q5S8_9SPHN|nr:MFS transporter [Sphingosinicella sp. GR2756]MDT9598755.1 MFS transporter [Sphingosinicella sp. GR2756]